MQNDDVVIDLPSRPVAALEDLARRALDAVDLLWNAGRLRGLVASEAGQRAFRGFLNVVAEAMTQMMEAERDGRPETALRVRVPRAAAFESIAFASTVIKLASDADTMASVGGKPFTPDDIALAEELIRLAKSAVDELAH